MLISHERSVAFLVSKIGPYVEPSTVSGKPRLIKGINEVWAVLDEFGGISHTAKHFSVPEIFVDEWICNHYIPAVCAYEIAKYLGYSNVADFQVPSTGYEDPITGRCWPITWQVI